MSETRAVTPAAISPASAAANARAPATRRSDALAPLGRLATRLNHEWLPQIAWAVSRTGRTGLIGLALLVASGLFFVSTHLRMIDEVATMRADLATASNQALSAPLAVRSDPAAALRTLPTRTEMPALLAVLLQQADAARLSIDTGKYEANATKTGNVVRYNVSFPVTGPYPQVRQFIDATLKALPSAAISELSIERKLVGDGVVEANLRLTLFTRSAP